MPPLDLTDDEHAELVRFLRETIALDRFPLSPHIKTLRAILAKLDPSPARPETLPPPKPPGRPGLVLAKKRRH